MSNCQFKEDLVLVGGPICVSSLLQITRFILGVGKFGACLSHQTPYINYPTWDNLFQRWPSKTNLSLLLPFFARPPFYPSTRRHLLRRALLEEQPVHLRHRRWHRLPAAQGPLLLHLPKVNRDKTDGAKLTRAHIAEVDSATFSAFSIKETKDFNQSLLIS